MKIETANLFRIARQESVSMQIVQIVKIDATGYPAWPDLSNEHPFAKKHCPNPVSAAMYG